MKETLNFIHNHYCPRETFCKNACNECNTCSIFVDEFKAYAEKKPEYAKLFTTYQELMQEDEEEPEELKGKEAEDEAHVSSTEERPQQSNVDSSKVKAE